MRTIVILLTLGLATLLPLATAQEDAGGSADATAELDVPDDFLTPFDRRYDKIQADVNATLDSIEEKCAVKDVDNATYEEMIAAAGCRGDTFRQTARDAAAEMRAMGDAIRAAGAAVRGD